MDAGSERSFEQFVQERSMALFRTAYLVVGEVHQAEDLLQSALEQAYRRWRQIKAMQYPEAYVRRVIVNLACDGQRSRRRRTEVALEEATTATGTDDTALVDLRQALLVGLQQLPVGMRTVLVLRYWEGLSEAEVAAELGRSLGTVKSQASRGLERLRQLAAWRSGLSELLC
jgi:RNA polymerase sigma-70 factor (sigma-E family)